ncbi:MAG: NF038122 family metalloprotease [Proteobacteria bacterium]|nr:NF038122 family metalloprotease [Pseudomonadota bacterium]
MSTPAETFAPQPVGLSFVNQFGAGMTDAYRDAILAAEDDLRAHITDPVTVVVSFDLQALDSSVSVTTSYNLVHVSYETLTTALKAHASTAADAQAIAGLPTLDPSHGAGFDLTTAEARVLGLAQPSASLDASVVLNSNLAFSFGQDAVGAIEHALSQGVFGRIGALGANETGAFAPMDLFRFTAAGEHDFTGGSDGQATYFGLNSGAVTAFQFHNSINVVGATDGLALADWDHTVGDAFGPGGPGSNDVLSATDLQVLDVLGWTPAAAVAAPAAPIVTPEPVHMPIMHPGDGWVMLV